MINEIRKNLEKKARVLKKIEPFDKRLEELSMQIDEIRDKFINPNDYPELLNNQNDVDIELEEMGFYFDEQIAKQRQKKQKLEEQTIKDYESQMREMAEELISYQEEKDKIDRRLKFWESKTSIKSQSAQKRIESLKQKRASFGFYMDNLIKKRDEITRENSQNRVNIQNEEILINRYQQLKENIIERKKQKFNNNIFGLLRTQAYQLEQLFYTISSQRNKIINDNRDLLAEFNLSKIELPMFAYNNPKGVIENSDTEEQVNNSDDTKKETNREEIDVMSKPRMTRMERLHPEKFKELQELKKSLIQEAKSLNSEDNLIPETHPAIMEVEKIRAEKVREAEKTERKEYTNPTIPSYFNKQNNSPLTSENKQYDVNQTEYPTPAVNTPEEIGQGRPKYKF